MPRVAAGGQAVRVSVWDVRSGSSTGNRATLLRRVSNILSGGLPQRPA